MSVHFGKYCFAALSALVVVAGLILFYNSRLYAGLGVSDQHLVMHRYGTERSALPYQ